MATAKIACCSVLLGSISCKTKTSPNEATPPANDQQNTATQPEEPIGPILEIEGEMPAFPDDFGECRTELSRAFPTDPDAKADVTDATENCCTIYVEHLNQYRAMSGEYRMDCCTVLNWQAGPACTPWGPPTPPRMA